MKAPIERQREKIMHLSTKNRTSDLTIFPPCGSGTASLHVLRKDHVTPQDFVNILGFKSLSHLKIHNNSSFMLTVFTMEG